MDKHELNALMLQVQNQDEVAFEKLYNACYKGVFSFIYSYVKNYHTAEDLLQDTFIKVKQKADSYVPGSNVSAWILQIAKTTSLDYLRKESNKEEELNEAIASSEAEENDFYLHDLLNKVLEDTDRQIVLLHLVYGYKNREIAKILDIPIGTVLWRFNKSMKLLKEKVKEDHYEDQKNHCSSYGTDYRRG